MLTINVKELLFVYGTLRKKQSAHRLIRKAQLVANWATLPFYTMVHVGTYPAVVVGGKTSIHGEIYKISTFTLKRIDAYEHVPHDFIRHQIMTPFGQCWMYVSSISLLGAKTIKSGNWCER